VFENFEFFVGAPKKRSARSPIDFSNIFFVFYLVILHPPPLIHETHNWNQHIEKFHYIYNMVKRQKEKLYQSASERSQELQSNKGGTIKPLPFECCALTLTPYETPVMRVMVSKKIGIIFENSAILPYLMKHKIDPITGEAFTSKELYTLHMDKDEETGQWQCPVLNKPFQKHTKIAAVIQRPENEAYVYSYEALQELCFKTKNFEDLTTGKKFNKHDDVIILQDPQNEELNKIRDINNFVHTSTLREENKTSTSNDVRLSVTATRILDKVKRKRDEDDIKKQLEDKDESTKKHKITIGDLKGVTMTSGQTSGSFTSSSMRVSSENVSREATNEELLQSQFDTMRKMKKKGFVRLTTSLGVIDLEIHCDFVPRTSCNFIGLVEKGAYNGSMFHRCIPDFMVQGGKPAQKGEPETSLWGDAIRDEFDQRLTHSGGGILSMANKGAHTNARQFFITFKSAPHLDRKHSIFGRVVKGMDVLKSIESMPTDKKDRPLEDIKIVTAEVLFSPIQEAIEKNLARAQQREQIRRQEKEERRTATFGTTAKESMTSNSSLIQSSTFGASKDTMDVGRYLNIKKEDENLEVAKDESVVTRLPPPPKKTVFGDFSGW
jgi:peptidyl-prolyl cis-trans isomerase-like 2